MAVSNLKVEHEFDEDIKPFFSHQPLDINDEVNLVTESTDHREVECHVYYTVPESERVHDQEDPLADTAEWISFEQVNLDDELLTLQNLPPVTVSDAFSIVNPIEIVESDPDWIKVEPKVEDVLDDLEPVEVQFEKPKKKRKATIDEDLREVPLKKINLGNEFNSFNVVLKDLAVNIGPKLPECFIPKNETVASQIINTNATSQVLRCSSCKFTCQDPKTLKAHNKEHVVLRIFTCSKCNHKCTNPHIHKDHVSACLSNHSNGVNNSIHNSTPRKGCYHCEVCSFKFINEQNLIVHENKHVLEKLFKCYICDTGFFTNDKLRNHFVAEHKSMEKVFACNICQYNTFRHDHIKDHMYTHNSDKHLYCYSCRKNYEDEAEYNEHFLLKHKKNLQQTHNRQVTEKEIEIEETNSNNSLNEDEENFINLKSSFVAKTILINNIYQCNGCVYKFVNYENLAVHKNVHLNVSAPYKCRVCAFESLCAIEIKKHLHTHSGHNITVACNVCKKLLSGRQIRPHAVLHFDDGLYCFSCCENYENTQTYKQHLSSKHGTTASKLISCNQCSFKHPNYGIVKRHTRKHNCKRKDSNDVNFYDNCKAIKDGSVNQQNDCLNTTNNSSRSIDLKNTGMNNLSKHKQKIISRTKMKVSEVPCVDDTQTCKEIKDSNSEINISKLNGFTSTFKCNKCSFQCTKVDTLERHDTSVHASSKHLFKCNACSWKTSILKLYLQHIASHEGAKKYSCCYCDFVSYIETRFANHVTKHISKCCPYCVFKSNYFQNLKRHLFRQHKPGNEPFSCSLCPYNTAKRANLSTHCIMFHPSEFCSLRLPIPRNLLNSTTRGCGLCSFKSDQYFSLKRHVPRHFVNGSLNKEKLLGQQRRLDRPEYIKEQISNQEEKPRKTEINRGMNICYRCSQCPYTSNYRKSVANHLFKKHNICGGVRNHMIVKVNGLMLQKRKIKAKTRLVIQTEAKTKKTQKAFKQVDINMVTTKSGSISGPSNQKINGPEENVPRQKTNAALLVKNNLLNPVRKYACNVCPYRCFREYDLKRHKARHLASATFERKEMKVKEVPTKIKYTTNLHKNDQEFQLQETVQKSAISKNCNVYYSCSQCSFKSLSVRVVARHLMNIHNIYGGLRNQMIIKVIGTLAEPSEKSITAVHKEGDVGIGVTVQNKTSKPKHINNKKTILTGFKLKKFKDCYEKCFKCKIHLLSTSAQIEHKRVGHKAFWDKPFSCTNPKCGSRFTERRSLNSHLLKSCSVKLFKNTKDTVQEKRSEEYNPANPISDDESFSCGECDYVTLDVTELIQHMFIHSGIADD